MALGKTWLCNLRTDRAMRVMKCLFYGFCEEQSEYEPRHILKKSYLLANTSNANVTKYFTTANEAKRINVEINAVQFKNCQMQCSVQFHSKFSNKTHKTIRTKSVSNDNIVSLSRQSAFVYFCGILNMELFST